MNFKTIAVSPLGTPQSKRERVPSLPSVAGGAGQHVAENSVCLVTLQSPLTPSIPWEQLAGAAAGPQELKTERQRLFFFLTLIFIGGDCLHLRCQSEGHHSTATA